MKDAASGDGRNDLRWVIAWLICVCALIAILISIGGYTRLTNSGLSIVEWAPISGIVPPTDELQWQDEFENYKQFQEFKVINPDLKLGGFKRIFWIEYLHRLIARIIALVFFIPFLVFLIRGQLGRPLALRFALVFVLGGAQGALGWYMVQSGLANDPAVSQYRLAAHLSLAVLIYSYLLWLMIGVLMSARGFTPDAGTKVKRAALACILLAALMQVSGGFMAGTHAGFAFNSYPLMNGELVPAGIVSMEPLWVNLFDNVIAIQWVHRWMAVLLALAVVWLWLVRSHQDHRVRILHDAALAAVVVQFMLGVTTLLTAVWLPVALMHQAGFVAVCSILIILLRLSVRGGVHGLKCAA